MPLISVTFLTKILNYLVYFDDNRAFIVKKLNNKTNNNNILFKTLNNNEKVYLKVLATATLNPSDRLYHIDDMTAFKRIAENKNSTIKTNNKISLGLTSSINKSRDTSVNINDNNNNTNTITDEIKLPDVIPTPKKKWTLGDIKKGSARIDVSSLRAYITLLQWIHVRCNHLPIELIRWMIQYQIVLGAGVTWEQIKDLKLGACDACMHAKMHSIPIPPSISYKEYAIGEYLSSDHIPFSKPTIRGYTGAIIYVDKASGKLFIYLVKSKTQWLQTLKDWIRVHGSGKNPRVVKIKYLLTDYASEVHSKEFANPLQHDSC
jgi:hypothetical protein